MATLAATSLVAIERLFVAAILAVVPRQTYKGAESWTHYDRAQNSAIRMRRFRIVWGQGSYVAGGIFTTRNAETDVPCRIRTDYAGDHSKLTALVQDDWLQLRDVLQLLTAVSANGLMLIHTLGTPSAVADNDHGRQRLSSTSPGSSDTHQLDLGYTVRYNQARA